MRTMAMALCAALIGQTALAADAPAVRGEYLESRNADIFTGPCFSNSEIFIVGDRAVLVWKIDEGSWDGIKLDGLIVAAAVRGSNTFSEDRPAEARSVVIVDRRATPEQRDALVAMAKHLAKGRLDQISAVRTASLVLTIEDQTTMHQVVPTDHHAMPQAPVASFRAPGLAEILARPLSEDDHVCGNEVVAYAPLSEGVEAVPAYTVGHSFRGDGLNSRWSDPSARSTFVGRFAY